jgi:hypothetical protein
MQLTGGRGPAHLPGQPRCALWGRLRSSRSGQGTNGPSTTGPAPRIRVSQDSLCWRIGRFRDSAMGRPSPAIAYSICSGQALHAALSTLPRGRRRSSLIHLQWTAHPRWKSRHPTVKIRMARPTGRRLGSSGIVSRAAKVQPPGRRDTDSSVNGPATWKQWDSESGRKSPAIRPS